MQAKGRTPARPHWQAVLATRLLGKGASDHAVVWSPDVTASSQKHPGPGVLEGLPVQASWRAFQSCVPVQHRSGACPGKLLCVCIRVGWTDFGMFLKQNTILHPERGDNCHSYLRKGRGGENSVTGYPLYISHQVQN